MSLDRPSFPVVRFVEGYDAHEVDHAVEMVLRNLALPQPRVDRSDIEGLRFTPVRLQSGYDISSVDSWFDEVVAELEQRPGEAETVPAAPPPSYAATSAPPPSASGAIVEVRSGSSLWLVALVALVVLGLLAYVALA